MHFNTKNILKNNHNHIFKQPILGTNMMSFQLLVASLFFVFNSSFQNWEYR
jgi:hypothetical protein